MSDRTPAELDIAFDASPVEAEQFSEVLAAPEHGSETVEPLDEPNGGQ